MPIPPPFEKQRKVAQWILDHPRSLVTSDPGTGKTRSVIDAFADRPHSKRMLVLAPLSILEAAWVDDVRKFMPWLTVGVAMARRKGRLSRKEAVFMGDDDIVVTNHDMVKWLAKEDRPWLEEFDTLCIDEFTAFKNPMSHRSRAAAHLVRRYGFPYRVLLSGTPFDDRPTDIWQPMRLLDDGERLGRSYHAFRSQVCVAKSQPTANGHLVTSWEARESAAGDVAMVLADINIRYRLDEFQDLPDSNTRWIPLNLPADAAAEYRKFMRERVLVKDGRMSSAEQAATKMQRLLQFAAGVVYADDGSAMPVHGQRVGMVADLVEDRDHTVVAFQWTMQRDALRRELDRRGLSHATIDGSVSSNARGDVVRAFQDGRHRALLAQPQAAGHGLTLTRANTVVWMSPTYRADLYTQTNHRVIRAGQKRNTEIIHIYARNTCEHRVYAALENKLTNLNELLGLLAAGG